MKNALTKDFIRDIKNSKGRFISIMLIVALGVAFFSGIKDSPLVMQKTSDLYYDDYNLSDIRIVSTLGLTDNDVEEIKKIDNIEGINATYSIDAMSLYKDRESVVQIQSFNLNDMNNNTSNYINRLKVVEGRLPEKTGECVLEKSKYKFLNYPIGSTITLSSGTDEDISEKLKTTKFKVVGYVNTPYYLSHEKGNTSIGSGVVEGAIMMLEDNFSMDVYTDIYLTVKGARELDTYSDEYQELIDTVVDDIEGIKDARIEARYDEIIGTAKEELEKGKKEYEENKAKAEKELNDAQAKLDKARLDIKNGKAELITKKKQGEQEIENGKIQIENSKKQLEEGKIQYEQGLKEFEEKEKEAQAQFESAEAQIQKLEKQRNLLAAIVKPLEYLMDSEYLTDEQKERIKPQIDNLNNTLAQLDEGIAYAKSELQNGKNQLEAGRQQLADTKAMLESSEQQIKQAEIDIVNAEKTLAEEIKKAEKQLADAEKEVESGQKTLDANRKKAELELSKAEKKIDDAEREINKIEHPTWYILDRDSHRSFAEYEGCANSIDALAKLFPVFFFAVAALVCLTTMTRMVDEQRINIGTLKGLGYGVFDIAKKYILYAFLASIMGSILGLLLGFTVFPMVIFYAYGMMYSLPTMEFAIDVKLALFITAIAILVTTVSAFSACKKELAEEPSVLMRPKAPKTGKRILLERISFIWNRLGFISKVTIRNIFRYKKRFLMTVLGISGCTALLVTGFGIRDSIQMIVSGQYGELFKYDMEITTYKQTTKRELQDIVEQIEKENNVKEYGLFMYESGEVRTDVSNEDVTIVVPDSISDLDDFITLRERIGHKSISLNDDGLILSEKTARVLGATVGDTVKLKNGDDITVEAKVSGITENYISHYAYMTKDYYKKLFNHTMQNNKILGKLNDTSQAAEKKTSASVTNMDGVSGVIFNTASKETFSNTIKNLNYVMIVIIASAGALAFVVLYNLTNVNISERIREIATIKVLGFYDGETAAYIYRENIILTVFGAIAGLGLGKILHQYIVATVEVKSMMFGRIVTVQSYIIAAVLTVLLSCIVNFVMYYKLKNVKMVESLKSVD